MIVKIRDFATVRTGLVTARKKAQPDSINSMQYEQISLRYFSTGVKLDKSEEDIFVASEELHTKYLAQEGDVVVRLRSPSTAVYIEKEDEGLLIHSLLAVIRVGSNVIDPKYLAYAINATATQRSIRRDVKGTAIPMLKTKDLEDLEIAIPAMHKQKELVMFLELADKERELLLSLVDEKQQLSQTILDTIIEQNKEKN